MSDGRPRQPEQQRRLCQQLQARGIRDSRVLEAIACTPRELFMPPDLQHLAYDDNAYPIGRGQTISQPFIVALMTEALQLQGDETVLEIGTGSGYQTAILAELCPAVVTLERIEELSIRAQSLLDRLGLNNIEFAVQDGSLGWPARAPYQGILVTAAAPEMPAPLFRQLAPGGRLVIPMGNESVQDLQCIENQDGEAAVSHLCGCRFVKLIGQAAWKE